MRKNTLYILITAILFLFFFTCTLPLQSVHLVHAANNTVQVQMNVDACGSQCQQSPASNLSPSYPSTGGFYLPFSMTSLHVVASTTSAIISFDTNYASQVTFSWGITPDYELGTASGLTSTQHHEIPLSGLEPGTKYYFKIICQDANGNTSSVSNQQFTTISLPDTNFPPNVSNLEAVLTKTGITLSWQNPTTPDVSEVIVTRSPYFFPRDPSDGKIIYEGNGTTVTDTTAVPGVKYYYSVFTKNTQNNYSSGQVISVPQTSYTTFVNSSQSTLATPATTYSNNNSDKSVKHQFNISVQKNTSVINSNLNQLNLSVIYFIQHNKRIQNFGNTVFIDPTTYLTVSIPADYIDQTSVGSIILNIQTSPELLSSTFLKFNEYQNAYEATIDPRNLSAGSHSFSISLYSKNNELMKAVFGSLSVPKNTSKNAQKKQSFLQNLKHYLEPDYLYYFGLIFSLIILLLLWITRFFKVL